MSGNNYTSDAGDDDAQIVQSPAEILLHALVEESKTVLDAIDAASKWAGTDEQDNRFILKELLSLPDSRIQNAAVTFSECMRIVGTSIAHDPEKIQAIQSADRKIKDRVAKHELMKLASEIAHQFFRTEIDDASLKIIEECREQSAVCEKAVWHGFTSVPCTPTASTRLALVSGRVPDDKDIADLLRKYEYAASALHEAGMLNPDEVTQYMFTEFGKFQPAESDDQQ